MLGSFSGARGAVLVGFGCPWAGFEGGGSNGIYPPPVAMQMETKKQTLGADRENGVPKMLRWLGKWTHIPGET